MRLCALLSLLPALAGAQAADGFWTRTGPIATRSQLDLPKELRDKIEAKTNHVGKPLGYSYEQMLGFPPFENRLRSVENLFRDVMAPAEYGGLMGDNLLSQQGEPAQVVYMLWSQLDARAGRTWAVPTTPNDWGASWVPAGAQPFEALRLTIGRPSGSETEALRTAGESTIRFLARLAIGANLAAPYCRAAFKPELLQQATPLNRPATRREIYDMLVSPYLGDVNDDTIVVQNRATYDTLRTWDRAYAAFGSALFMRHFDAALAEYKKAGLPTAAFAQVQIDTPLGAIKLGGSGRDVFRDTGFITLDLGGDDQYTGIIGSPRSLANPISVVVDLGGNDTYDGTSVDGNVGCGLFGVGLIDDLGGNDTYKVKNGGIAFGLYGTGAVIDETGNDVYEAAKGWSQGAAYAGVGLLLDRKGNDKYRTICMSMGFGGTEGVGTLVDVNGDDSYFTADTGNPSKAWGKSVSMCLGSGYGRRNDSGDGHNQGGGFGIVVEGAGNDKYHTSIFSLGSGYWWGAGIFEERGGDDVYRFTHYCLGSGAHFAVGSFVDLSGDDKYNDRPDALERWGGLGRDGSIAVCIDADGNDVWGNLTGGHSDLNSYSLFWDRRGDDVYKRMQPFDPNQMGNRPFGSSVIYTPMRNFRDRLPSIGVFLDTGGRDIYPNGMTAADSSEWQLQGGPLFWGYGLDTRLIP